MKFLCEDENNPDHASELCIYCAGSKLESQLRTERDLRKQDVARYHEAGKQMMLEAGEAHRELAEARKERDKYSKLLGEAVARADKNARERYNVEREIETLRTGIRKAIEWADTRGPIDYGRRHEGLCSGPAYQAGLTNGAHHAVSSLRELLPDSSAEGKGAEGG